MPIHILAPEVANQIAAGEVVERPASAVKELIENSLDAGATDIRVEVREGGRRLIRVQDDGCGIPAAEAALAFERHATSKLATADDLSHLSTLGFRGEALASIASVAQVALLTRARDEETGTLIRLAEGREIGREPRGGPPGTLVTVEHLFANVPARLKFLKQPATEAAHIQQIVTRYALAYPERRLSLVSDGKLVFQSTGSGKLYDVLVKVYGLEMAREMLEIRRISESANQREPMQSSPADSPFAIRSFAHSPVSVTGYIGSPSLHRGNRGYITLFVNRRWFQDTSIAYSVIQAYHTMLPVGRYPVAVVFIELPPEEVDVNVHPTKAEVRFRESGAVFSAVQKAVRRTLTELAPIPQVGLGGAASGGPAPDTVWPGSEGARPTPFGGQSWSERRDALLGAGQHRLFTSPGLSDQASGSQESGARISDQQSPATSFQRPASSLPPSPPPPRRRPARRDLHRRGRPGRHVPDRPTRRARARALRANAGGARRQPAGAPTAAGAAGAGLQPRAGGGGGRGARDTLNHLGVEIEPFGGASYLVRSLPAILGRENPDAALSEIVDGLAQRDDLVEATREARLVTLICKRAAIKGNTPLSMAEMQELVRRLEGCRSPRTCPHGRPTMVYLSSGELARQFGRV